MSYEQYEGWDRHADKRDRAREKAQRGHVVSGTSVRLINEIVGKRAKGELPARSGKGRKHRGR